MSNQELKSVIEKPKRVKTGGRTKGGVFTHKKKFMLVFYDDNGNVQDTKLYSTMKEIAKELNISTHRARYYFYQTNKEYKGKSYHTTQSLSKFKIKKINGESL